MKMYVIKLDKMKIVWFLLKKNGFHKIWRVLIVLWYLCGIVLQYKFFCVCMITDEHKMYDTINPNSGQSGMRGMKTLW